MCIRDRPKTKIMLVLLITIPMWINMLVRTYAWMGILQNDGIINTILGFFGIGPVKMLHTSFAVILGMVYNFIPFMILQIYTSLTKMAVSYTHLTHYDGYLETAEGRNLPVIHCIKDTEGWKIDERVFNAGKGKCASVIDKPTFGSEELAAFVKGRGYDKITLIGLCTDICVISNALLLKAALWETPIAVDRSCCAGVTPESHERALGAMGMCQIEVY